METSEEGICSLDKKEVLKEYFEGNGTLSDKPSKQRKLKEHITTLHYDCNNASTTLLKHHNTVTLSEAVIDLSLKMGDKTGILKRSMQLLKI